LNELNLAFVTNMRARKPLERDISVGKDTSQGELALEASASAIYLASREGDVAHSAYGSNLSLKNNDCESSART
jgi:hypothetical protein